MSDALVCHCLKISHGEILLFLEKNPLVKLEELVVQTGAGSRCQACITPSAKGKRAFYLKNILEGVQGVPKEENPPPPVLKNIVPFSTLSLFNKILAVQELFKATVLPLLHRDGGDAEIMNIVDFTVTIKYLGACRVCPSSRAGTLEFIRETLGKGLGEKKLMVNFMD